MRFSDRAVRLLAFALVVATLLPALPTAQSGFVVTFPRPGTNDTIQRYDDTIFVGLAGVTAVAFDERGDIWYASPGGVVHEAVGTGTRQVFTSSDGLPASLSLDLAIGHGKVYVSTDTGLGIIDEATGKVTAMRPEEGILPPDLNTITPDAYTRAVAVVGDQLWVGTHSAGVAIWNLTTNAWFTKNTSTTATFAKPIRGITVGNDTVWVATDGDGGWRYNRSAGNVQNAAAWTFRTIADGLFNSHVMSVQPLGDDVWFATHTGLARWRPAANGTPQEWRRFNESDGLPDDVVSKLSVVPDVRGVPQLIADTKQGVWQYDPATGGNQTLAQNFGIYGAYVVDDVFDETHGWAFATQRGVSWYHDGIWTYFTTGPSSGPSNGPGTCPDDYRFTAAGVGDSGGYLWFGRPDGITAYMLPRPGHPGRFYNLGLLANSPLCNGPISPVTWLDTEGNTTWFATFSGAYGLNWVTGKWIQTPWTQGISYAVDASQGDVWIAAFGDGVYRMNESTQVTVRWNKTTAPTFPDFFTTDVRVAGNDVWVGGGSGVTRMNRATGVVVHHYAPADGLPGDGFVYRVLPDGGNVYVGMRKGGIARLDVASGQVTKVWNHTTDPAFPDDPLGEVDAMHRDGRYLYAGTHAGLVRIDLVGGGVRTFDARDGLVQEFVTGVNEADGILYLSTYAGIARFDTTKQAFLPMQDGPGVVRVGAGATGTASGSVGPASAVSARIDTPRDGSVVAGQVTLRGTAFRLGGSVDRVEVRIADGAWQAATGAETWSFVWDTAQGPLNAPVPIEVRAVAGNETSPPQEIILTPVPEPKIALTVRPTLPDGWIAGRDMPVSVYATGDEPLKARLYYMPQGATTYTVLPLTERDGSTFRGTIPGRDLVAGNLTWYAEAESNRLLATSPEDLAEPATTPIAEASRLAVEITGPAKVAAPAGVVTSVPLTLRNTGTEAVAVKLSASGVRVSWAHVPAENIPLAPGETRVVNATLDVPAAAIADTTNLTFSAQDVGGAAIPATTRVPVEIQAARAPTAPPSVHGDGKGIPAPGLCLVAATVAAAALLLRRRRA